MSKNTKKIKVGLTSNHGENIWGNGLGQNVWNLYRLLKKAGFDVSCVSEGQKIAGKKLISTKIKPLIKETAKKYDIIIEVVHGLTTDFADYYVNTGGKIAGVQYGNNLLIHTEDFLFRPEKLPKHETRRHEIWTSPHYEFAIPAYKALEKIPVHVCPYIWDSDIFDVYCRAKKYDPFFKQGQEINSLAMFEPNLNMVKTSTIPILIIESYFDSIGKYDKDVYVFGALKLKDNNMFQDFIQKLNVFKHRKISFEGRWHTPYAMHKGLSDLIVSHQWENHLNYLQLETMYTNRPCVHNNPRLKEYGFYYDMFDVDAGREQLSIALETHSDNFKETSEMNKEKLWDYNPLNQKNVDAYAELITNLVETK